MLENKNELFELKISLKNVNASFVENKITAQRAYILFGEKWKTILKQSIEQLVNEFKQCNTCGSLSCPPRNCIYYNSIKNEREAYKIKHNLPQKMKTMGKYCGKCGHAGGHWLNNFNCTSKRRCNRCGSTTHGSIKCMQCPVITGWAIRCLSFDFAFNMNKRYAKNKLEISLIATK